MARKLGQIRISYDIWLLETLGGPNNTEKAVACLRSCCPWQRIIVFPALMRKEKGPERRERIDCNVK